MTHIMKGIRFVITFHINNDLGHPKDKLCSWSRQTYLYERIFCFKKVHSTKTILGHNSEQFSRVQHFCYKNNIFSWFSAPSPSATWNVPRLLLATFILHHLDLNCVPQSWMKPRLFKDARSQKIPCFFKLNLLLNKKLLQQTHFCN